MAERWKEMVDFIIDRGSIENCMIVSSDDGSVFATSNDKTFYLREYSAVITQEDGSEKNETVNEANNLVKLMKGQTATQGLRINGTKKQQITRSFKDDETELQTIFSKFPMGGSCVANGGKCFLVATYNEVKGHTSPACNETITLMARYFAKSTWPTGNPSADSDSKQAPANWQSYVDMLLIGKGNIAQALICSAADGTVLAASDDFKFQVYEAEIPQEDGSDLLQTVDEAKNVLQLMQKSKPGQGLRVNRVKYQVIRSAEDENSKCYMVLGKKTMGGCALFLCGKVVVVGTYDEARGHTSPACNAAISDVAKYLRETL